MTVGLTMLHSLTEDKGTSYFLLFFPLYSTGRVICLTCVSFSSISIRFRHKLGNLPRMIFFLALHLCTILREIFLLAKWTFPQAQPVSQLQPSVRLILTVSTYEYQIQYFGTVLLLLDSSHALPTLSQSEHQQTSSSNCNNILVLLHTEDHCELCHAKLSPSYS